MSALVDTANEFARAKLTSVFTCFFFGRCSVTLPVCWAARGSCHMPLAHSCFALESLVHFRLISPMAKRFHIAYTPRTQFDFNALPMAISTTTTTASERLEYFVVGVDSSGRKQVAHVAGADATRCRCGQKLTDCMRRQRMWQAGRQRTTD